MKIMEEIKIEKHLTLKESNRYSKREIEFILGENKKDIRLLW